MLHCCKVLSQKGNLTKILGKHGQNSSELSLWKKYPVQGGLIKHLVVHIDADEMLFKCYHCEKLSHIMVIFIDN